MVKKKDDTVAIVPNTLIGNGTTKFVISIQKLIIAILLSVVSFFLVQIYNKLDTIEKVVHNLDGRLIRVEVQIGNHLENK